MDGLEAVAAIREKEKDGGFHQPIIALTAHAMNSAPLALDGSGQVQRHSMLRLLFARMAAHRSGADADGKLCSLVFTWAMTIGKKNKSKKLLEPRILIFDVDGVLIDVRGTYWRSGLETVRYLSGKRVTYAQLFEWKSKPGYNDDWRMTADWVTSLGRPTTYQEARAAFEKFYWGTNGKLGNVRNEKFLVTAGQLERWASRFELNLFTGRTRQEFAFTFDRWPQTSRFRSVVTMDDVTKGKPDPEGLLKILGGRDPASAVYVGDNIDDALAARDAGVPFVAILAHGAYGYRRRAARFRELGARAIVPRATGINAWIAPALAPRGSSSRGKA
jgi:HAD superfamily phosphatase